MAYGKSYEEAVELLYRSAKKEYCWAIRQLKKLLKR
jgi:hypothetical protein